MGASGTRSAGTAAMTRPSDAELKREDREPKVAKVARANPKEVLDTMPWPASITEWGKLQRKIWAGHPPLANGWIRVWSKSKDSEYYLRLRDMKTTFMIDEVRED